MQNGRCFLSEIVIAGSSKHKFILSLEQFHSNLIMTMIIARSSCICVWWKSTHICMIHFCAKFYSCTTTKSDDVSMYGSNACNCPAGSVHMEILLFTSCGNEFKEC